MRKDDQNYFADPEFQRILEQYENACEQGESIYMDAEELTDIAEYYMTHNEEAKANECIELAVSLHPDATDPQIFLARQQLFHDNIAASYSILDNIQDQSDREVIFLRAELLLKEKKTAVASAFVQEYYDNLYEDRDAFIYDIADIFYEYEYYEEAMQWAKLLLEEYPKYPEAEMLLVDILLKMGKFEEAQIQVEALVDKDPFNQNAWMALAEALALQEKCEESLEASEYLLAINEKHPEAMLTRASNLFYLNRIAEAHDQYQAYLTLYPDEYAVLYLDGICLANLERHDEARTVLQRALEVSNPDAPERIHIHLQLAYVYSKLSQLRDALDQLDQCNNYPTPETPIDMDLARGHIYLENGEYEDAERHFDAAIRNSKNPFDTLLMIGITLGETGHYTKAVEIFQNLHDSTMENAEEKTSPYLAYCHLFLNNKDLYLQFLKEAARLNPNTTQFLFSQFYPGSPVADYYEIALKRLKGGE